jgi:hypothetical protein
MGCTIHSAKASATNSNVDMGTREHPIISLKVRKIFTKVLTNRVMLVAQRVINPSQTTFLPGRYILGVVILHDAIHEMHRKKKSGVILKLDFEKAYDKVK